MRSGLLVILLWTGPIAAAQPTGADGSSGSIVLKVGEPHTEAIVYGPADMLCDFELCRMLKVPGLPANAEVDFQAPNLKGDERADLRRCFRFCRASVLGYVSNPAGTVPDPHSPSFTIVPVELRLQ